MSWKKLVNADVFGVCWLGLLNIIGFRSAHKHTADYAAQPRQLNEPAAAGSRDGACSPELLRCISMQDPSKVFPMENQKWFSSFTEGVVKFYCPL